MKEHYSSFICEHTAEYVLVPRLTDILKQKFKVVIPIFPWLTREGSNLSKAIHRQDEFKIVGLYPRRPKVNRTNCKILIKINNDLILGAREASRINIPMITGCPLARNLRELDEHTMCVWIKLTEKTRSYYKIEHSKESKLQYEISQKEEVFNSSNDIINYINRSSKELDFENFIKAIRTINGHRFSNYFIGGYKPVYFLLKDN